MALQEFLASYAVEVDEAGAKRLLDVLAENRDGAAGMAASFQAAGEAVTALTSGLRSMLAEPVGAAAPGSLLSFLSDLRDGAEGAGAIRLPLDLDLSAAEASASFFTARMEALRPGLSVNTSGITAAVAAAVASVRSMLSSLQVTVPVRAVVQPPALSGGTRGNDPGASVPGYASGARVDAPTLAMIGEGGDPEYVIPARDDRALPLLRSLLGELSDSARRAFVADLSGWPGASFAANGTSLPGDQPAIPDLSAPSEPPAMPDLSALSELFSPPDGPVLPDLSALSAELAALTASARHSFLPGGASAGPSVRSLEAPVNITVAASSASPEAIGRSVYDLASQHLLRAMEGVFG